MGLSLRKLDRFNFTDQCNGFHFHAGIQRQLCHLEARTSWIVCCEDYKTNSIRSFDKQIKLKLLPDLYTSFTAEKSPMSCKKIVVFTTLSMSEPDANKTCFKFSSARVVSATTPPETKAPVSLSMPRHPDT